MRAESFDLLKIHRGNTLPPLFIYVFCSFFFAANLKVEIEMIAGALAQLLQTEIQRRGSNMKIIQKYQRKSGLLGHGKDNGLG